MAALRCWLMTASWFECWYGDATGEQVKSGSGQGILIGAPFQLQPRQLLWGGVRNRSHGGVGGNKPTGVSQFARNSE